MSSFLCEGGYVAGEEAVNGADRPSAQGHEEEGEDGHHTLIDADMGHTGTLHIIFSIYVQYSFECIVRRTDRAMEWFS